MMFTICLDDRIMANLSSIAVWDVEGFVAVDDIKGVLISLYY